MAEMREIWPGWETIRVVGKGGFGKVYEVRKVDENAAGDYRSALKVISIPPSEDEYLSYRDDGYDDESISSIFKNQMSDIEKEFALMAQFKGTSHIVSYEEHMIRPNENTHGWDILIRMELLTSLPNYYNQNNGLEEKEVVKLGLDICKALELCGKKGIVHRDIKPQNIFINKFGDYKLGDFGIARSMDHTTGATKTGTYAYMAPEVYRGKPYNASVDMYSLGLVMYWLLNERRLPFLPLPPEVPSSSQSDEAQRRRMSGDMLPAPQYGSKELHNVIMQACAYDPKKRFKSVKEMERALENLSVDTDEDTDYFWEEDEPETGVLITDDKEEPKTMPADDEDEPETVLADDEDDAETVPADDIEDSKRPQTTSKDTADRKKKTDADQAAEKKQPDQDEGQSFRFSSLWKHAASMFLGLAFLSFWYIAQFTFGCFLMQSGMVNYILADFRLCSLLAAGLGISCTVGLVTSAKKNGKTNLHDTIHTAVFFSVVIGAVFTGFGCIECLPCALIFASLIPFSVCGCLFALLWMQGRSRLPLLILFAVNAVNYVLCSRFFVIQRLYTPGAVAIWTGVSSLCLEILAAVLLWMVWNRTEEQNRLRLKELRIYGTESAALMKTALPFGVLSAAGILFCGAIFWTGREQYFRIAAGVLNLFGIYLNGTLASAGILSLFLSMTVLAAGDSKMRKSLRAYLLMGTGFIMLSWLIGMVFVSTNHSEYYVYGREAASYIIVLAVGYIFMMIFYAAASGFQRKGKVGISILICLIGTAAGSWLPGSGGWPDELYIMKYVLGWMLSMILLLVCALAARWKEKR